MEEQVASSAVPPQVQQPPSVPNFEEMRRIAMQQAIEQKSQYTLNVYVSFLAIF